MYDVTGWPLGLPQPTHSLTMGCSVHFGRRRGGQFLLCIVHETRQARGQAGREKAVNDDSPSQRQGKEMQIDEPKFVQSQCDWRCDATIFSVWSG